MKLLLVTSYLDDGGAEKWVLDTVSNMNKNNISIDYYFWGNAKNDRFISTYKNIGVNLHFRNLNDKKSTFPFTLKKDFSNFIKENGPYDTVHVNGTKLLYQMEIMKISKKNQIPVRMVHSHNPVMSDLSGIKKLIRNYFRKSIIKNATIVGGCSKLATQTKYGDDIINNKKYFLFKNGINYKKYSECNSKHNDFRTKLNLGSDPVFLHIGRFNVQKNHNFLIDIFSEITKLNNKSKLILIGHGEDEDKIFKKIKTLKLENNIIHIPYTSETEIYYSAADLFLLPSLYEGLPLVLLEAQSSGIPCLISDKISDEIFVNDNIESFSLNKPAKEWALKAMSMIGKRCDNAQLNIYNAGYDISTSSQKFLECCTKEYNNAR